MRIDGEKIYIPITANLEIDSQDMELLQITGKIYTSAVRRALKLWGKRSSPYKEIKNTPLLPGRVISSVCRQSLGLFQKNVKKVSLRRQIVVYNIDRTKNKPFFPIYQEDNDFWIDIKIKIAKRRYRTLKAKILARRKIRHILHILVNSNILYHTSVMLQPRPHLTILIALKKMILDKLEGIILGIDINLDHIAYSIIFSAIGDSSMPDFSPITGSIELDFKRATDGFLGKVANKIVQLAKEHKASIAIGFPWHVKNWRSSYNHYFAYRKFARILAKNAILNNVKVAIVDERGTSKQARKLKIQGSIHEKAATLIAMRARDPKFSLRKKIKYL
ncbi:MAG: hypothetical protein ACP6IP_10510 [Candidatus Njordarchaeia archaeon]